jgi:hypothetical protein
LEDPRIQHYHVRRVEVDTNPAMLVMADGLALGEGPLCISILRHAVPVMVGASVPKVLPGQSMIPEGVTEPTSEFNERKEIVRK